MTYAQLNNIALKIKEQMEWERARFAVMSCKDLPDPEDVNPSWTAKTVAYTPFGLNLGTALVVWTY